jgi:signal transduction histidine kinase
LSKGDAAGVRDLEKRLAEALERQAEAVEQLQVRDRELAEALDQQTATAEILSVISQSRADVQPVFDAIANSAVRICHAAFSGVFRFDGSLLHLTAHAGLVAAELEAAQRMFPARALPARIGLSRVVLNRTAVHIADIRTDVAWQAALGRHTYLAPLAGYRTFLAVPLLHDDLCLGAINVWRREVSPFSDKQIELLKTFADQAVIAIQNVRLFTESHERNTALTQAHAQVSEALEQQTATSEILRVIASSPTDIQPVLDAVAESAARLCRSYDCDIFRLERERLVLVAHHGPIPGGTIGEFTLSVSRGTIGGRTALERRAIHVADLQAEGGEFPDAMANARAFGLRTMLSVPLLREGTALGVIQLRRTEVSPFTDRQAELLQTFADQAVIAIENTRLFNETKEALERQTATSEILGVISSSPTNVQPVFDAIVESAVRLVSGQNSVLFRLIAGEAHVVAQSGLSGDGLTTFQSLYPGPLTGLLEMAVVSRRPAHTADMLMDHRATELGRRLAKSQGHRAILFVPLLQGEIVIGVLSVSKSEPLPFTASQIALLQTFADQAVIAIENVRLFKELQTSNRDLTTALEQQTATGEILQTITQAQTDVQPVFETIVRSATGLCHAAMASVSLTDGRLLYLPANYGSSPEAMAAIRARFPRPLDRETVTGTALLSRSVIQVPDVDEPSVPEFTRQAGQVLGYRSVLAVPMLRQGEAVGAINVTRREPGPFPDAEVALLQTFADQAVIAIENVRLFKELQVANRELAAASQHKSEFLANMSHELRTPLNAIIGFSEVLSEKMFGELNEKQEEYSKDIHASGQHLLSLINDILDLSKVEAGRMALELTDFDLPTAIDNALMLVRERAGRRSLALHTNIDNRLGQIQADERKVRQVVLNLLSNAIKFTPEGGRIEVEAVPKDSSIEVSVSDNGIGIAPEDQEKVFEEFRQVGTVAKKIEGTGLGLTLCRKFVELHGGRIWVNSELGQGSTFTFTIPVRRGE